jgi:hypothetical protein
MGKWKMGKLKVRKWEVGGVGEVFILEYGFVFF